MMVNNVPEGTGRQSGEFCEELDKFIEEVQKKYKKEVEEASYTQTQETKTRPDVGRMPLIPPLGRQSRQISVKSGCPGGYSQGHRV